MSDYILPKLLRSPGVQVPHVYSPPDNADTRLKESMRERWEKLTCNVYYYENVLFANIYKFTF